jgi:hypothetical protein
MGGSAKFPPNQQMFGWILDEIRSNRKKLPTNFGAKHHCGCVRFWANENYCARQTTVGYTRLAMARFCMGKISMQKPKIQNFTVFWRFFLKFKPKSQVLCLFDASF